MSIFPVTTTNNNITVQYPFVIRYPVERLNGMYDLVFSSLSFGFELPVSPSMTIFCDAILLSFKRCTNFLILHFCSNFKPRNNNSSQTSAICTILNLEKTTSLYICKVTRFLSVFELHLVQGGYQKEISVSILRSLRQFFLLGIVVLDWLVF